MKHSSWTLFLVPLTLPLALLFLPRSINSADRSGPSAGTSHEVIQELSLPNLEEIGPIQGSGDARSGEDSEALFKE